MTPTDADSIIKTFGIFCLAAVVFSLASPAVEFPGQTLNFSTGITPLVRLEFARNGTELASILGPPGSENRRVLARLSAGFFGSIPAFILFFFPMNELARWFRPDLNRWDTPTVVLLVIAGCLDYPVVHYLRTAASAPVITDDLVSMLRHVSFLQWNALFLAAICSLRFIRATPPILRVGGIVIMGAVLAELVAMSYNDTLVAPLLLVIFTGMCGMSSLLLLSPEVVYEDGASSQVVMERER